MRTGYSASSSAGRIEAFRQGLRYLGYVEGQNIGIEYRYAEGVNERLSNLAAELVQLKVDIIITSGYIETASVKPGTGEEQESSTPPGKYEAVVDTQIRSGGERRRM